MRIQIRIYSVLKNRPNTNTNSILFENVCQIRTSLFGLNYSNTIQIPNYSLTSVGKFCRPLWSKFSLVKAILFTLSVFPIPASHLGEWARMCQDMFSVLEKVQKNNNISKQNIIKGQDSRGS